MIKQGKVIYLTSHFEPKYLISFDIYFCYLVFGKKFGGPYQFESFSLVNHVYWRKVSYFQGSEKPLNLNFETFLIKCHANTHLKYTMNDFPRQNKESI